MVNAKQIAKWTVLKPFVRFKKKRMRQDVGKMRLHLKDSRKNGNLRSKRGLKRPEDWLRKRKLEGLLKRRLSGWQKKRPRLEWSPCFALTL